MEKNQEELKTEVKKLREELLSLRFQQAARQLKNPLQLRGVRRDLARALTFLKQGENRQGENT